MRKALTRGQFEQFASRVAEQYPGQAFDTRIVRGTDKDGAETITGQVIIDDRLATERRIVNVDGIHIAHNPSPNPVKPCECALAPCGLIDLETADIDCPEHGPNAPEVGGMAKHLESACPGRRTA
jgi:hypothetical protein